MCDCRQSRKQKAECKPLSSTPIAKGSALLLTSVHSIASTYKDRSRTLLVLFSAVDRWLFTKGDICSDYDVPLATPSDASPFLAFLTLILTIYLSATHPTSPPPPPLLFKSSISILISPPLLSNNSWIVAAARTAFGYADCIAGICVLEA